MSQTQPVAVVGVAKTVDILVPAAVKAHSPGCSSLVIKTKSMLFFHRLPFIYHCFLLRVISR